MSIFIDLTNDICEYISGLEIIIIDYHFSSLTSYEFDIQLDSELICEYVHNWFLLNYDHRMNCSTIKRDIHILNDDEQVYKLNGTLIHHIEFDDTNNMRCKVRPDLFSIDELKNCPELILYQRDKKLRKILDES